MNTVEQDGKTYVRVVRKDPEGRKKQFWRLVGKRSDVSQRKIREALADLEREVKEMGVSAYENKDTLNQWLDKWLEIVQPTVRARTFDDYKNVARLYIRPALGKKRLKDIDTSDIEMMVSRLQRKLGARTVRYAHTVLSMSLKRAKKKKIISANPAEDVENLPKKETREMTALLPEQAVKFLEAARSTSYWLVFKFAILTGTRPEEYLALQWKDVDLSNGTVTIQRVICWSHWEKRGSWRFENPKTERSRRTLDIPQLLLSDLKAHWEKEKDKRLKNHDLVFPSKRGTPIGYRNLSRGLKSVLKDAGLPNIRLYDLRHSFATLLLGAGENIKVISALLGHSDETETMRTYLHVTPAMKRNTADTLERIFKKG